MWRQGSWSPDPEKGVLLPLWWHFERLVEACSRRGYRHLYREFPSNADPRPWPPRARPARVPKPKGAYNTVDGGGIRNGDASDGVVRDNFVLGIVKRRSKFGYSKVSL